MKHSQLPLTVVVDADDVLVYLGFWFDTESRTKDLAGFVERHGAELVEDDRDQSPAVVQLHEYLAAQRRDFDLPLRLLGTDFQRRAWQALIDIPFGQTRSYGQQAKSLDNPGASRAVGLANGQNPIAVVVPCHRVVGADGSMTGFGGGLEAKRWLLELERRRQVPAWSPKGGPRRPDVVDDRQLGLFAT